MKKFPLFLLFLSLVFTVISCTEKSDEDPLDVYREIAYNSLSMGEKETIIGDWRDADVSAWVDGYYLVTFNTTQDAMLGPIQIVVDPDLGTVVEKFPRF